MLFTPLCPGLKYPANVALVNLYIREIVLSDVLPTDVLDEKIYDLPEDEPYNLNQQMFDNESKLFASNASTLLWLIFINMALLILYAVVHRVKFFKKYLGK